MIELAEQVIENITAQKTAAENNALYYKGAIDGINLFLEELKKSKEDNTDDEKETRKNSKPEGSKRSVRSKAK